MKFATMLLSAATLLMTATLTPAIAQESNSGWTGFSVYGGLGGGAVVHELDFAESFGGLDASANFNGIGGEGWLGTVGIGYDVQLDNRFVLGVFGDYDFSGISTDASAALTDGTDTLSAEASIDHNYSWTIGGRAGILMTPQSLIYGLVGYTRGEFEAGGSVSANGTEMISGSKDYSFDGYTLGTGFETMIGGGFSLKGEYRYTSFDEENVIPDYDGLTVAPSLHTGRVSLSYKLNRPETVDSYK